MIRELDISGIAADNLYMGDLDSALGMCPNLEVFRLENCYHISNILVQSIAHHCPNLLQLDLPGNPISDSFIPVLTKKCKHLLRLDLSFTNITVASMHPIITHAESLLELDLSECREAEDLHSLDLSNKGFRRPLKSLNLRNTPVTDDLLRFAVSQCPELEIIVLESCARITDDAVMKLIKVCNRLRVLDLSFCDKITDLSLNALTVHGTQNKGGSLEELFLSACDLITPAAVQQMVQKNTKLELLVLDGCERMMGSFVQELASVKNDELECTLEREAILALSLYNSGVPETDQAALLASMMTPPQSPPRGGDGSGLDVSGLKVEVTYATGENKMVDADAAQRRKNYGGFAAAAIKNLTMNSAAAGGDLASTIAAAKEAAAQHAALMDATGYTNPGSQTLQRRSSRSLRHRRSMLGLSAREENEDEIAEAAKYERQEKIREKRRSRNVMLEFASMSDSRPPSPPLLTSGAFSSSALASPPPSTPEPTTASSSSVSTSSAADGAAAKFMAAAAAMGVKIGNSDGAPASPPRPQKKMSTASLRAEVPEFVPQGLKQTSEPDSMLWDSPATSFGASAASPITSAPAGSTSAVPLASGRALKRASFAQGAPPGSVVAAAVAASNDSVSPVPPSATGEAPVLLFSGRAARAASISKDAPTQAMADAGTTVAKTGSSPTPAAEGSSPEPAPLLIASGRRRTRGNSVVMDAQNEGLDLSNVQTNTAVPTWINQPPSQPTPASNPGPWGTDPAVWNNPAQLTSSSSTWSTASNANQGFVDPWARPPSSVLGPAPVTNSTDPWAAPPPSASVSSVVPPSPITTNIPRPPTPSTNPVPASPATSANNNWNTPIQQPAVLRPSTSRSNSISSTTGWTNPSAQQQQSSSPTSGSKPARPTSVLGGAGGRFGSLGASRSGSTWPGQNAAAAAAGFGAQASATPPASTEQIKDVAVAPAAEAPKAASTEGGFVFSGQKRGRMLLKLKIETKTGGHQTLAVHEVFLKSVSLCVYFLGCCFN
jgi:hypothetical protein